MQGSPVSFVAGVEAGNPHAVAVLADDGTEHVAIREEMCGPDREEFIQCESGLWLPKLFLFRQPVGSNFKHKIGPINLVRCCARFGSIIRSLSGLTLCQSNVAQSNPFMPDAMYERIDLANHEDNAICILLFELSKEQGDAFVDDKLRAWTFTRSGKTRQDIRIIWADGVPKPARQDLCSLQFRTRPGGVVPEAGANYAARCRLARKLRMPGAGRWHAVPPKDAAPGQDTTAAPFDDLDYGSQMELGDDHHLKLRLFAREGMLW